MQKRRILSVRLDDKDYQDFERLLTATLYTPAELVRNLIRNATVRPVQPAILRTELDTHAEKVLS